MAVDRYGREIFGRLDENGNVRVLYAASGAEVRELNADVYPFGSSRPVRYEHPDGIILSQEDAARIGLDIEGVPF